jgi:hypothetical protein
MHALMPHPVQYSGQRELSTTFMRMAQVREFSDLHPAGRVNVSKSQDEPLCPVAHHSVVCPRLARRITGTLKSHSSLACLSSPFLFYFPFILLETTISLAATRGTSTPAPRHSTLHPLSLTLC